MRNPSLMYRYAPSSKSSRPIASCSSVSSLEPGSGLKPGFEIARQAGGQPADIAWKRPGYETRMAAFGRLVQQHRIRAVGRARQGRLGHEWVVAGIQHQR